MYLYSIIGIYNISFSDKISISLSPLTLSTTGDILYYCIWKFDHFKHITMHVVPSKHFFSFLVIVVNLNDVFPHKWMAMLTLSWQLSSCKELTLIIKSFFFYSRLFYCVEAMDGCEAFSSEPPHFMGPI